MYMKGDKNEVNDNFSTINSYSSDRNMCVFV